MIHKDLQQPELFDYLTMVMLGIASLIGWNAVLTGLDYFAGQYTGYDVYFYFGVPLQFANFIFGLLLPQLAIMFSLTQRVVSALLVITGLLVFLPILADIAPNSTGYTISLCINFIIGACNSISQNSSIGLTSTLSPKLQSIYWISTGISGLSMNVLRAISLAIFGTSEQGLLYGTIVYFIVAGIMNIVTIYCFIQFQKRSYYQSTIIEKEISLQEEYSNSIEEQSQGQQQQLITNQNQPQAIQQKSGLIQTIISAVKIVKFIPFFIWLIYVQTFMMFPGVSIQEHHYHHLNDNWGGLIMTTLYNFGDVVGKYFGGIQFLQTLAIQYITVLCRFVFYILFILIATGYKNTFVQGDYTDSINMFLFGATNGFCTAGLMALGPRQAKDQKQQELIGFIGGFALTFGITCGTFLAIPFTNL